MLGLDKIAKKIFGSTNDRYVKSLQPHVQAINALEDELTALSDEALAARTVTFRQRLKDGETVDDLMVDAFATVREAAKRTLGLRHYDVQLIGGMILHQGKISEMKTGEGKTLVATLAVYLNALPGNGVHVVTVNDYLAQRDAEWMGQIYRFLGLTVGCIVPGIDDEARKAAYKCDITYATNNELGFDYLRDNMKFHPEAMVQRPFHYAVVDEVDSILIDEARTPLIISGPTEDKSHLYLAVNKIIPDLVAEDYDVDEKSRAISLTEQGNEHLEELLVAAGLIEGDNMYDFNNVTVVHHCNQALKAHKLFQREKDYIVKEGKVVIIDEFTGRMMEGRRYSDGLHQALEAKEGVDIHSENQTLASVTFQNYFRNYPKLAGMTGTAATEASEFADIYRLEVIEMPTHVPVARIDAHDEVYRTVDEKFEALTKQILECHDRGQPVLVGTVSIEKSELLASVLKKKKITHKVLNAKFHEQEAFIIAQAGRLGAVTIATNMAGRGTDIQLGGNLEMRIATEAEDITDEAQRAAKIADIKAEIEKEKAAVLAAGGLYVIGTERHESRRIDNQLRGRSGRQGDPGASKFYLSLEDDLMRIFGGERMDNMLQKFGIEDGEAIIHPWINRAIEKAQEKVEAHNYEIRKNLLKYDNVMNDQRKAIYDQRREIMDADDLSETITDMRNEVIDDLISKAIPPKSYPEEWDTKALSLETRRIFAHDFPIEDWVKEEGIDEIAFTERLEQAVDQFMAAKAANIGPELMRQVEKSILLQSIDAHWKEHLSQLDNLRAVVGLRAYGQRDPLNEYKTEAFTMFEAMLEQTRENVTLLLAHVELQPQSEIPDLKDPDTATLNTRHIDPTTGENDASDTPPATGLHSRKAATVIDPNDPNTWGRVSRNAPCPCGSGKKYKHCHGQI